jgi:magnesium transporter
VSDGLLQELDCSKNTSDLTKGIWIDLLEPAKEQEEAVEALLHVDIPTGEEVRSIDESSQIYQDEHALVMTARVISKGETTRARLVDVTFILADDKLITLRYGDPTPFRAFVVRAEKS